MEGDTLGRALTRAVAALGSISDKEIQQLPLRDCACILSALPDTETLSRVRALLAGRLRSQLSTLWVNQGDAYEVYAALTALWTYSPAYVAGEWLAAAVRRLVQSEAAEGGPYYAGNTVAVAANAQIAIFVSMVARPLPNMQRFLEDVIAARRFTGTELTRFALLYLLAAACDGDGLAGYIKNNWRHTAWQTPWRRVVALTILKGGISRTETEQTLLAVCEEQQRNGFWKGEPLLKGGSRNRGSSFVTTALITEALRTYLDTPIKPSPAHWQRKRQIVARAAMQMFKSHPEPLCSSALTAVDRICHADTNFEITLLPHFFANALDPPKRFANTQYTTLGLANLYVWIAYTIYDDFIDSEGKPAELPVANVAMRASLDCFRVVLPQHVRFHQYVAEVFAGMDEANAWEIDHCRFALHDGRVAISQLPRYGKCTILATRAFAHALTPMAILTLCPTYVSKKSRHIETAFRHYLIARQLNDDMHDWVKDMRAGQASYVVTAILRDMRLKQDSYIMDDLLPAMRRRFRRTTMPKVCQRMLLHIALSRQHFAKSQLLHATNDIYQLLDNLEQSAHQAIDKQAKGQALAGIHAT